MCDPIVGVMAGLGVASAVTGSVAQKQQEEAQIAAVNEANLYNANMAIKEQLSMSDHEGIQQQQERQSLANEKLNMRRDNMQRTASVQASSMASGNAYNLLMGEYSRINGNNMSTINQQLSMQNIGHDIARRSYEDNAKARIGGLQGYKFMGSPALNILSTGLQIGASGLDIYNDYNERTRNRDDKKVTDK